MLSSPRRQASVSIFSCTSPDSHRGFPSGQCSLFTVFSQPTCMSEETSGADSYLCDRYTCNHRRSCGQSSNSAPESDDVGQ